MANDLSSLFMEQQTNLIDWHGPLYSLYDLPVEVTGLIIRFRSAVDYPLQGLRLKVRGGTLEVDSSIADDVVLWRDTAPEIVRIRVDWNTGGTRSLRVWNAWRANGVTQAWLGNAGMRVSAERGNFITLECSDGEGEPSFDDLVAEVELLWADRLVDTRVKTADHNHDDQWNA